MIAEFGTFPEQENASTDWTFNDVRLSTRTIPAHQANCGGDWCETFVLCDDIVALSIGDVCGHDTESFPRMVLVRRFIREAAYRGLDPARALAEAGRFLRDGTGVHATAIFAWLDTKRRTVTFANAGHPPPLMASAAGAQFLEFPSDCPLGVAATLPPTLRVVSVPAAALLVFYTDGVTERERDPILGEAQLLSAGRLAQECPELSDARVIERQMCLTGPNRDDAAILTARMPSAPAIVKPSLRGHYPAGGGQWATVSN